ncbi:hypothetical protein [Mucilaginibacter aquatilis]|uniref:Uncharacterized protein n=1 Tax=Mucilaginibacter aquatilis TaxID=1517760 RepID=A0A6I4IC60_9SPHI|nr:hypothetical protein [Mucilaginibacter aquatilis]MVN91448.1 hypothetical protein [Mucilaginibacter aquatilis]
MSTLNLHILAAAPARIFKSLHLSPWKAYLKFLDNQESYKTMWWFINLVVHANLVLAVPAVLVYYYNASVLLVGLTVGGFFANLVANMGGFGIRVTLTAFFASLLVNFGLLTFYICV